MKFFVVQPYGRDKGREATVLYEAPTASEAFAEVARIVAHMKRTGVEAGALELLVVDEERRIVPSSSV